MRNVVITTVLVLVAGFLGFALPRNSTVDGAFSEMPASGAKDSDLEKVRSELSAAEAEASKYQGGLVLSMITLRIETLKNTQSMLEQYLAAARHGIRLRYTVNGQVSALATPEELAAIMVEYHGAIANAEKSEAEAARYTGGLVQAMTLASAATSRMTAATILLRYYTVKYGMPASTVPKSNQTPGATPAIQTPTVKSNPIKPDDVL